MIYICFQSINRVYDRFKPCAKNPSNGAFNPLPQECRPVGQLLGKSASPNFFFTSTYISWQGAVSRAGRLYQEEGTGGEVRAVEIDGFFGRDIFKVTDNLMAPKYEKGDHLVCTPVAMQEVPNGSVVVMCIDNRRLLCRVHYVDGVLLLSENYGNKPTTRQDPDKVKVVWKVENKLTIGQLQRGSTEEDRTAYLEQHILKLHGQLNDLIKKLGGLDEPKNHPWDGSP